MATIKMHRMRAVYGLGAIGAPAIDALLFALKNNDRSVCGGAARSLSGIADSRAFEALIAALKDSYENVRLYAAKALGKHGDIRAIEPLTRAVKDFGDWERHAAVEALRAFRISVDKLA